MKFKAKPCIMEIYPVSYAGKRRYNVQMGQFIGHVGGFFILAAVVLIVGVFTLEAGLVKKNTLVMHGKTALYTTFTGIIFYLIMVYMKNTTAGQTNAFDFRAIFGFCQIDKMIELYGDPTVSGTLAGLGMPLFPFLVHILGKIIFEQYAGIAVWLNFLFTAGGMCCLYCMACDFFERRVTPHMVFAVLTLPFMFLLFTPAAFGVVFGLASGAAYALYKGKTPLYVILGILAVLSGKLGLVVIIPLILSKIEAFPGLARSVSENRWTANPYVRLGYFFFITVVDGVIMFLTIGGIA